MANRWSLIILAARLKAANNKIQKLQEENERLIAVNENLNVENESLNESIEYNSSQNYRMEQRNEQLRRERDYADQQRRDAENDAYYKQAERQQALKSLERAKSWGDSWGEERALRKLKNL